VDRAAPGPDHCVIQRFLAEIRDPRSEINVRQIAIGGYLRLVPLPLDAAEYLERALAERAPEERRDAIREKDDAPRQQDDAPRQQDKAFAARHEARRLRHEARRLRDPANRAKTERTTRTR